MPLIYKQAIDKHIYLVDIKADLRSNSELLAVNQALRAAKISLLDGCAYSKFRLFN